MESIRGRIGYIVTEALNQGKTMDNIMEAFKNNLPNLYKALEIVDGKI